MKKIKYTLAIIAFLLVSCDQKTEKEKGAHFDSLTGKIDGVHESVTKYEAQQAKYQDSTRLVNEFPKNLDSAINTIVELMKKFPKYPNKDTKEFATKDSIPTIDYCYDIENKPLRANLSINLNSGKIWLIDIHDKRNEFYSFLDFNGDGFVNDHSYGDKVTDPNFFNARYFSSGQFMKLSLKDKKRSEELYLTKLRELYVQMKM